MGCASVGCKILAVSWARRRAGDQDIGLDFAAGGKSISQPFRLLMMPSGESQDHPFCRRSGINISGVTDEINVRQLKLR